MRIAIEVDALTVETSGKLVKTKAEEPVVIIKDDDGKEVKSTYVGVDTMQPVKTTRVYPNENGKVVETPRFFLLSEENTEEEIKEFDRSKELVISNIAPSIITDEFLIEHHYSLVPLANESPVGLYKICEYLLEHDLVGVSHYSWGGTKEYVVFLRPIIKNTSEGTREFAIEVLMTRATKQLEWIPVPVEQEVYIEELPEMEKKIDELLSTITKGKKKKEDND